jgi:hypothetical protein
MVIKVIKSIDRQKDEIKSDHLYENSITLLFYKQNMYLKLSNKKINRDCKIILVLTWYVVIINFR